MIYVHAHMRLAKTVYGVIFERAGAAAEMHFAIPGCLVRSNVWI